VVERAESLLDRLPGAPQGAFLEDLDYTIGRLRELVRWLAVEAGGTPDAGTVDGSVIEPGEAVMEALHTAARHDAAMKATKAEKAEAELLAERRDRILPDRADLEKIARYEAHLSRQMYQALHELEALQARRGGKAAPLARLDVQT
jgi:predicted RNase H-like nuclease (RuvC/YqgF family)